MTAQRNTMWQAHVRALLREGYGAEDIALITDMPAEAVRAEIAMLRAEGELTAVYGLPDRGGGS